MARLIALYNAGAEAELNHLLSSLKETRSRSRRMHSAQGGGHGGGSPGYPGYVTTTAEADSASASPDLDDDDEEELFSPMAVEDDGDEDYDPSGGGKPRKARLVKPPTATAAMKRRPSYDMVPSPPCAPQQVASPSMAAMASMASQAMAPGGPSRPPPQHQHQHPTAAGPVLGAPGASRMAWPEEPLAGPGPSAVPQQLKQGMPVAPVARRPGGPVGPVGHVGGGKAMKTHPARMSKTGRVIKPPRRDGSYVYAKMPHHQNSMTYPGAGSASPAYRQSPTLEAAGSYDSPHVASQPEGFRATSAFGHVASTPATPPAAAPASVGNSGALKQWSAPTSMQQPPMPSLQPIGNSSFNRNVPSDAFKQYNSQHVQARTNSPSLYPCSQQQGYGHTSYIPMSQSYQASQQTTGSIADEPSHHFAPLPPTQVIRPIPLPAAPANDFSTSLEWIVNVKADNLKMPLQLSPYWKPANTNSVNSYSTPISFTCSRRSSLFQDPTRIQPYMPPISNNPFFSQHGTTPTLHHTRQFKDDYQIPASAQYEMLQVDQLTSFYGVLQPNQGPPPLLHRNPNSFVEDYSPALASPTNQPAMSIESYQDHQNWQHQEQLEPWMPEPEEQKYHPQQIIKKQPKQMHVENQHKSFMLQQTDRTHHQQYPSTVASRQTNPQGHTRRTSFPGNATAQLHRTAAPVKKPPVLPYKSQVMPTQTQRQTRTISSPSRRSLPLNHGHQSAHQQHASFNHHTGQHMQRSSHHSPTQQSHHQFVKTEYAQGPVRKKPCYQPNEASRQHVHSDKVQNQVPLTNPSVSQSQQIDVPNMLPLPNPDFRENNEISYPLIYDYLTSAEKQLEPIGSKPETSGNPIYFPTNVPTGSQDNFGSNANVSSSFIEEVIPSLTQHALHSKHEGALNSNLHTTGPVSMPSLSCAVVPHSTVHDSFRDTYSSTSQENPRFDNSPHVDVGAGKVQHAVSSPVPLKIQSLDTPSYSEFAAVIVENVHSIQQFESQNYAQLVPVPVESNSIDGDPESHSDMQLRLIKALGDPSLSLSPKNNNVPMPDQIDAALGKIVKDDKTKQVIFLCSDGTGEPEYMTLSVCQEEALNNSNSLPGTRPSTPATSDIMVNNINDNILEKDAEIFGKMSSDVSHISQVSTVPVTNSDQSTETASSISDYLSQSRSALDTNTNDYLSDESASARMTPDNNILERSSDSSAATTSESDNGMEQPQMPGDALPLQVYDAMTARTSAEESLLRPDLDTSDCVVPSCSTSVSYRTESLSCQVPQGSVPLPLVVSEEPGIVRHVPSMDITEGGEAMPESGNESEPTAIVKIADVKSLVNEKEAFDCDNKTNAEEDGEVPDVVRENQSCSNVDEIDGELLQKPPEVVPHLSIQNVENTEEKNSFSEHEELAANNLESVKLSLKSTEDTAEFSMKNSDAAVEQLTQMDGLYSERSEVHDDSFEKNSGSFVERSEATLDTVDQVPANVSQSILHIKEEPMDLTKEEIDTNLVSENDVRLPDPLTNLNEDDLCEACDTDMPDSILPDVNMNTIAPSDCAVSASKAEDVVGHTSPLYLTNEVRDESSRPSSPLVRNKSASKIYPGKQVRQPVRCSPRQSVRSSPNYAQMSVALPLRVESALHQPAKGRKPCPNVNHGCPLVLPPAQLSSHHLVCEYSYIPCPAIGCAWECIAKKLSAHIRESHRPEIGVGTDSEHTVFFHEIRQQQRLTFLREVSRKLFVICIHAHDNSIFATMQYIASGRAEKPISATGTLEVIDAGGSPHAWRGKIGPIQQRLDIVRDSGNCLQIAPEILGAIQGATITFHTNIRVNMSLNHTQSASTSESSV